MPDEQIKSANAAAASDASGAQGAEEDSETEERSQEPDLGTVARERSIMGEAWEANVKRTYDVTGLHHSELFEDARAAAADARLTAKGYDVIAQQILANMAENARFGNSQNILDASRLSVFSNLQQSQVNANQTGPTVTKA